MLPDQVASQCAVELVGCCGFTDEGRSGKLNGVNHKVCMMKLTARDGVEIDYSHYPAPSGAPRLVLVHSLALDRSVWTDVIAALAGQVEIAALDCRGHGASEKLAGPYTIDTFGNDIADLVRALGWEKTTIAGSSMGGSVALRFVTAYPELTAGAAFIDTTAWYGADAPKNWGERASKAEAEGLASLIGFQQTRWFSDAFRAAHPEVGERAAAIFLANDIAAYAATCRMLGAFDLRAELAAIATPVEVLVGEEDYATPPAMAQALANGITGAHLEIVPGARHLTTLEIPDKVAAVIRTVIARGENRAN